MFELMRITKVCLEKFIRAAGQICNIQGGYYIFIQCMVYGNAGTRSVKVSSASERFWQEYVG